MAVVAELNGKLQGYTAGDGSRYVDAEDPLTASIFESIEVMNRDLALGAVLRQAACSGGVAICEGRGGPQCLRDITTRHAQKPFAP